MIKQNIKVFTNEADIYYKVNYWRSDEDRLVNKYFTPSKGKKLLVLGCGGGRTLIPLHEKGFKITGIDIVPAMVEASKKRVKDLPIEIIQMDATKLEFRDSSFDYIFFPFHGIDCVYPDIYRCVDEARRVLKNNGVFIFNSHNRLYLKQLKNIFSGKYSIDSNGLLLYRTTPLDRFKLKKYFNKIRVRHRISLLPWKNANWKDMCYKVFPVLSKSTYFICIHPKNN